MRNTFVIFLVSGLWHGANWTFIIWGVFHAVLFMPLLLMGRNRTYLTIVAEDRVLPNAKELGRMVLTFLLATVGWAIFRARSAGECFSWIANMAMPWYFSAIGKIPKQFGIALAATLVLFVVEWLNRREAYGFVRFPANRCVRWAIYYATLIAIICGTPGSDAFVYFQF